MAEHKGYSNFETFAFKQWMDANVHFYKGINKFQDPYQLTLYLKDGAEEMFYDMMEDAGINGWMHDICASSLNKINFNEIAQAIINNNEKEKE